MTGPRRRGIDAATCPTCHELHNQVLAAGRFPPPVARALPGSDYCRLHLDQVLVEGRTPEPLRSPITCSRHQRRDGGGGRG